MKTGHRMTIAAAGGLVLLWGVTLYGTDAAETTLRKSIEQTSLGHAVSILDEIEWILHARTSDWAAYCEGPLVQESLLESNEAYAGLDDRSGFIARSDREWRETPGGESTRLMQEILDRALSSDLRRRLHSLAQDNGFPVFSEVFLTNRHGVNVAQSNRTSDFSQSDEEWWQEARKQGIYVADMGYDESAGVHSIDLCLRVDDETGRFLGVLKAVLNAQEVVGIIRRRAETMDVSRLALLNADWRLICASDGQEAPLADGSHFRPDGYEGNLDDVAIGTRRDARTGEELLSVYARARGYASFGGVGWILVADTVRDTALAPVASLRANMFLLALLATIGCTCIGVGVFRHFTRRIGGLTRAAAEIANGDRESRADESGKDEIALLARRINELAARLWEARDTLAQHARSRHTAKKGAVEEQVPQG